MARTIEVDGEETMRRVEEAPLALVAFSTQYFKQQNQLVDEVAEFYGDAVTVALVDIVAHPDIARRYGVCGLPLALVLRRGRVVREVPGAVPEHLYLLEVDPFLGTGPANRTGSVSPPPAAGVPDPRRRLGSPVPAGRQGDPHPERLSA